MFTTITQSLQLTQTKPIYSSGELIVGQETNPSVSQNESSLQDKESGSVIEKYRHSCHSHFDFRGIVKNDEISGEKIYFTSWLSFDINDTFWNSLKSKLHESIVALNSFTRSFRGKIKNSVTSNKNAVVQIDKEMFLTDIDDFEKAIKAMKDVERKLAVEKTNIKFELLDEIMGALYKLRWCLIDLQIPWCIDFGDLSWHSIMKNKKALSDFELNCEKTFKNIIELQYFIEEYIIKEVKDKLSLLEKSNPMAPSNPDVLSTPSNSASPDKNKNKSSPFATFSEAFKRFWNETPPGLFKLRKI